MPDHRPLFPYTLYLIPYTPYPYPLSPLSPYPPYPPYPPYGIPPHFESYNISGILPPPMIQRLLLCLAFNCPLTPSILLAQHITWNSAPKTGFVFQITNNEAQKLL